MEYIAYLLTGAVAGLLAGLLGVGGGVVIVPSLILVFSLTGFHPDILTHMAIGTSLATIVLTGTSSVITHHNAGKIEWPLVWKLGLGIVLGSFGGAMVADQVSGILLEAFFGVFTLFVAMQMWLNIVPEEKNGVPSSPIMLFYGLFIGVVSALLGIGGGTLTVPVLVWHGVRIQNAVAVSAACGLLIAISGAGGFVFTGTGEEHLPSLSFGYVYLPAFLGIILASIPCAVVGARLSHRVHTRTLKKVFAIALLVAGIVFIWQVIRHYAG